MKTLLLCVLSLQCLIGFAAVIDYSTLTSFSQCTSGAQSPISIKESICGPYGTFDLTVTSSLPSTPVNFDSDFGTFAATYTGVTLTYNNTAYTSSNVLVRYPAENKLNGGGDAEIQIIMKDSESNAAVLSFVVYEFGTNPGYKAVYEKTKFVTNLDPTAGWAIDFASIADQIMEKPKEEQFLNMYRYEGTLTYPDTNGACQSAVWYIYGIPLFVESATLTAFSTELTKESPASVVLGTNSDVANSNARPFSGTNGGSGLVEAERLCYSGYFTNYIGENYGLWFGVVIILLFFIATLFMTDHPISDPEYQESCKTIHPLYSIWKVGNDIFTKKSRSTLVLMTITMHALFSSTWYRQSGHRTRGSNIIVYAIYSMLISWAYTYMLGNILRGYYTAKYHYCKTRDEAWNQKAQNRIFAYYAAVFATICIAWPFTVWNMGELHPQFSNESSNYWVATFFVGLGLEFLLFDIIAASLAKTSNFLRNILRRKGYMYDNMCHETYMNALKMD